MVHRQRDEVGVLALRRALGVDQRHHQAGLCPIEVGGRSMTGGGGAQRPITHYSTPTRVLACVWIAVAVLLLLDVLWRGEGRSAWIAGAVLVASISLVYLVWLRPRVVATERGIRMVNPLREIFVPWSAVLWVDVVDVLRVHTPERVLRCWPLRENKRAKHRANQHPAAGPSELVDED